MFNVGEAVLEEGTFQPEVIFLIVKRSVCMSVYECVCEGMYI